ncbi:hypothetical protein ACU4GD_38970 [Cupriavidus basilensis]
MLNLELVRSRRSGDTLTEQIVAGIASLIDRRVLRAGVALPSVRRFAQTAWGQHLHRGRGLRPPDRAGLPRRARGFRLYRGAPPPHRPARRQRRAGRHQG